MAVNYDSGMTENKPAVAPGWYNDGGGLMRWWDGRAWTEHTNAPAVQTAVNAPSATQVVVNSRKMYKTSHGFHLVMSIITLGLWLPVWLIVGIYNAAKA